MPLVQSKLVVSTIFVCVLYLLFIVFLNMNYIKNCI